MYKELVLVKNDRNKWDYIFDIGKTETNPISTNEDAVSFLSQEFKTIVNENIIIENEEIYILMETQLPCKNCE
jgi:hypothetical protein